MRILKSIAVMLSTFTVIPMPQIKEWDEDSTRFAIGFFPLAGLVIGAALFGWAALTEALNIHNSLFAAGAAVLPILLTGGIHMDGFMDTVDAISSRQPRERKLEILKDPNTGAFAVIYCVVYMLLTYGLFAHIGYVRALAVVSFGYVLSRALSALNAVTLPNARGTGGMLASFTSHAHKRPVIVMCIVFALAALACMIYFDVRGGIFAAALVLLVTLWYRRTVIRTFGGATGDTSGFYLQLIELAVLIGVAVGDILGWHSASWPLQ